MIDPNKIFENWYDSLSFWDKLSYIHWRFWDVIFSKLNEWFDIKPEEDEEYSCTLDNHE